jgi:CubicO group peptidase (beta-lactamase class C family)
VERPAGSARELGAAGHRGPSRRRVHSVYPETTRNFRPTGYGYLWWVTTADHTAAFFALGFGGQLIEVVPQRHLVIVISTYVNLKTGNEMVNADDLQRLANAIVTAARRR